MKLREYIDHLENANRRVDELRADLKLLDAHIERDRTQTMIRVELNLSAISNVGNSRRVYVSVSRGLVRAQLADELARAEARLAHLSAMDPMKEGD